MKGTQRTFAGPRGITTDRNEWEGTLGRLNVLSDEINKALCRPTTNIEEPRSSIVMSHPRKIIEHGKVRRGFFLLEG